MLAKEVVKRKVVEEMGARGGRRKMETVKVLRLFCQLVVKRLLHYETEMARFLGMSSSAFNRSANSKELPQIKAYL